MNLFKKLTVTATAALVAGSFATVVQAADVTIRVGHLNPADPFESHSGGSLENLRCRERPEGIRRKVADEPRIPVQVLLGREQRADAELVAEVEIALRGYRAFVIGKQARHDPEQRRLSAAVGAHDLQAFTAAEPDVEVFEQHAAVPLASKILRFYQEFAQRLKE